MRHSWDTPQIKLKVQCKITKILTAQIYGPNCKDGQHLSGSKRWSPPSGMLLYWSKAPQPPLFLGRIWVELKKKKLQIVSLILDSSHHSDECLSVPFSVQVSFSFMLLWCNINGMSWLTAQLCSQLKTQVQMRSPAKEVAPITQIFRLRIFTADPLDVFIYVNMSD